MKKLLQILTIAIPALFIQACDKDRLDTPPLGNVESNFFIEQDHFFDAVTSMYGKMTDWYWAAGAAHDKYVVGGLHPLWHLPADGITVDQGRTNLETFLGINSSTGETNSFWDLTYELIQRANLVIEKSQSADRALFEDPAFLDYCYGEGLFIRSLAYYKLWNFYGPVPLITARISSRDSTNTPRAEGTAVLDQLVSDLALAAEALPSSWPPEMAGRATKNSAYGLLVKVLMQRAGHFGSTGDYQSAVEAFNKISGRSLTLDYSDNFDAFTENNEESLFEFQAGSAPAVDNPYLYNDGPWGNVESCHAFWGFFSPPGSYGASFWTLGGNTYSITQKLFDLAGTDPRIAHYLEPGTRKFLKYGREDETQYNAAGPGTANNVRIIRYADVMLLAAEAMVKSGAGTTEAIVLLNKVRKRARDWGAVIGAGTGPADYPATEGNENTVLGWIRNERYIELAGEEDHRWFDLKRWDAAGDIDLNTWDFSSDLEDIFDFQYPKHLLFPIPQSEIERNSAILNNNPGY